MQDETGRLTHGSLFSGYGGIDIALDELLGTQTTWVSDIEPAACTVLARRFPDARNLGDITRIPWADVPPVDVISGGSPCQDLSAAGRRAGMTEGTRSNLWVQMREGIETLRPALVVWENVMGALSATATSELESVEGRVGDGGGGPVLRALGRVLGDLSEIGFDAEWATVRASDVGAPHQRARVFLIAWPREHSSPADALRARGWRGNDASGEGHAGGSHASSVLADCSPCGPGRASERLTLLPTPRVSSGNGVSERELREGNPKTRLETSVALLPTPRATRGGSATETVNLLPTPTTGYSARSAEQWIEQRRAGNGQRRSVVGDLGIVTEQLLPAPKASDADFGAYTPAIEHWERATGRPAPAPTKSSPRTGKSQLSAEFVEWMMGLPAGWFTDPALGLTRVQQLRMGGNGVVPQQAAFALRGLMSR